MKNRWSLRGHNQGASLITVLVALIFVGIIAVVIMNITITNIQMREIEQSGKENFYDAEAVMDELTVGLNDIAAAALERAYTDILVDYRNIMVAGADIQEKFTRLYMNELEQALADTTREIKKNPDPADVSTITYEVGYYQEDVIKNCLSTANKGYLAIDDMTAKFSIDYEEGIFTLEKVCISYEDSQGYETTLQTDMVFHTPVLNFDGSNVIMDYMRYSIIADNSVEISAANINVDGNVYAGVGGIKSVSPGTVVMTGDNIITRGDIEVQSGTSMTIGNDTARIWAENVVTSGKGTASSLVLRGNSYIADDLNLNGKNSTVTLYGNYYGYNFQDNYSKVSSLTDVSTAKDSSYSSAMIINGKNSRLDLSNLNYLLLSGRTYISRGSKENTQNQDIMLGESISVRTNQLAYYVPASYLKVNEDDPKDIKFTATGESEYANAVGVANISSYLDSTKPIVPYYFKDSGVAATRYYLNFASEQKANDFFAAYYASNTSKVNSYAEGYAGNDAIILDNGTLYTFKGDVMYQTADGMSLQEEKITIAGEDWKPRVNDAEGGIYWEFADRLAVNYKSLQLYLEDSHTGVTSDDVRFEDETTHCIDKSIQPLLNNIMDIDALKSDYPTVGGTIGIKEEIIKEYPDTSKRVVVIVNNEGETSYDIPLAYTEGIVIATGDVKVQGNFCGMIIAGGNVSFAANASVTADELMVSQLFKDDKASGTPIFSKYFRDYNSYADSVIGLVKIDEYLTYDNWTKNGN